MKYSIEKVYKNFGQFDKVVTVSFLPNSLSFEEYQDDLTGQFYYTPKERKKMEEIIQHESSTIGVIKFKEILNMVNDEQKKKLMQQGINSEDISSVFTLPEFNRKNEFKSTEIRKLTEPTIIEIDTDDNFDYDIILLNFNDKRLSSGYKLIPDEIAKDIAIRLYYKDKIDLGEIPEELKTPIRKYFLEKRAKNKKATEKELAELKNLKSTEIANKILSFRNEIISAGIEKKNFEKIRPQIEEITPYLLEFNEKRLTHAKFPIWLNYERFLHVFLGHVNETNIGGKFKDKTKFQYFLDEIFRLIEIVLGSIDDEIQEHFKKNSGKNFKRHGEMSVYYKGDYYVIDINPEGLLMTFYKREL